MILKKIIEIIIGFTAAVSKTTVLTFSAFFYYKLITVSIVLNSLCNYRLHNNLPELKFKLFAM